MPPDRPGGTRSLNSDSQTPTGAVCRADKWCMRVSRGGVVPSGRAVPGAGAFGPRRCGGAPPHNRRTAVVLTADERGPLAPRTARSRLSRTLRRRRARAARGAPLQRSTRPRTKTTTRHTMGHRRTVKI